MAKNKTRGDDAPKKARARKSTRPRSTRQIAQQKTRSSSRNREPSRSQNKRNPGSPGSIRRKARGVVLIGGMALFGFLGVLLVDTVVRVQASMENVAFTEMWDKLLDRFLDNDVPRQNPSKKKPASRASAMKPVAKPSLSGPALPELKRITSSRADLQAPSPSEYAKATSGAVEAAQKESHFQAKSRLDQIISGADF